MFPCSADHEQDWQPYPVDPYSAECADYTSIMPRVRRHRARSPHGSSSNGCYLCRYHHGPITVRLFFPAPTIAMQWICRCDTGSIGSRK